MGRQGDRSTALRLLKGFDAFAARSRGMLVSRLGKRQAETLIRESRARYQELIPRIPHIGDKNPLRMFLLPSTRYHAIYRVLQGQGWTVERAGQLFWDMFEAELKAVPRLVRRAAGFLWFSRWFLARVRKRAAESQVRPHPGGYVLSYVEGDGRGFNFGIDYTECASVKFLNEQNAAELAPYMCALDKVASELLGWGLSRTTTIAAGCQKCDFRFKKAGKTNVTIPDSLRKDRWQTLQTGIDD